MSGVYFNLSAANFFQDWTNTSLITSDDNWDGVPSIIGYRGDDLTSATGTDPRTLTSDATGPIDVSANQTNPGTFSTGGVAEFAIANPTIALNGSGTADAPFIVLHLDGTGRKNLRLDVDIRDLDGSVDNATQQVNVQYRVGPSGPWTNVPGGYIADATTGPSLATQVTHLTLDLPAAVNGQSQIQVRIMTTNAVGNDEWVGIDNISVTSDAAAGASVSVGNVSISEGDSGTSVLTFTVNRSSNDGAFTLDYGSANGTATAGSDYAAVSGTLTFEVGGALSQTVSVTINGDTTVEPNETFSLLLSNLSNVTGTAALLNSSATGTINNDDVTLVAIHDIQGAGHTSPFNGQTVVTSGIVTAIDTTGARGFWIQDPNPDAYVATSEAIFIFTNSAPTVAVGDSVRVAGTVAEFRGSDTNSLTITEIDAPTITVLSSGNALPAAIVLGTGGRLVPTEVIDNDNFSVFDPAQDAIDFYESLEGMRVTIPDAMAVGSTSSNTTWVVANQGANATGLNPAGGLTISAGDLNPERVQIFFDSGLSPAGVKPNAVTGDLLGDVTGILRYFSGDYELVPTAIGSTGSGPIVLPRETTTLVGDANHLTIGSFNVENLDPFDPQAKFNALAANIRFNLGSPDIVGLEEVQDADGPGTGANLSGAATANKLIDAIVAAGGPRYVYVEVAPTVANTTGGEPNGNIRQGYLYNPDRVGFVSVNQIVDTTPDNGDAYANSRKPLVGVFTFNGETVTVVDLHSTSRGGSNALFGVNQPALNAGDATRLEQSSFVKAFVEGLIAANPTAKVVVMGDFNAFQFEPSLTQLESGGALTNLNNLLAPTDRYSYNFEGNSQQLDHMLASPSLYAGAQFDIVHLNSSQASVNQTTDHDGLVGRFQMNIGPTAVADTAVVNEDASVTIDVLANDNDPNAGDTKTVVSVSATTKGATLAIVSGKVVYTADPDSFDLLTTGQSTSDSFSYVMRDTAGATSTATVQVTISGVADGATRTGGSGADSLTGTVLDERLDGAAGNDSLIGLGGTDTMVGGAGNDTLDGGSGIDSLSGGDGNDLLVGGLGNDVLTGGRGLDVFVFGPGFGRDVITDFRSADDDIRLVGAGFVDFNDVLARATQVGANVVITGAAGDSLQLNNIQVGSLQSSDFLFA